MTLSHAQRIKGGLWGLLIGDALGVPYEFNPPTALPPLADIEMTPPANFRRAHRGVPPGTWSDDGAQALALLESLLVCGQLDLADFGQRLVAWYRKGDLAVDSHVFDIGIQTSQALHNLEQGVSPAQAGPSHERTNGNGALMRVLPLALWHQGTDEALVADAARQGLVTHGHLRSQLCCALYCLWARRIIQGEAAPWADATRTVRQIYRDDAAARAELDEVIRPEEPPAGQGTGYVLDSLHSARLAVTAGGYEQVVKAAVAMGNDTDTTACIAGGIAGLRDGFGAIPERWVTQLRGEELLNPLWERLRGN